MRRKVLYVCVWQILLKISGFANEQSAAQLSKSEAEKARHFSAVQNGASWP
jgi:hypothetical protein